jgi:putative exosortase-associated protein (TIGR04073 family)
MKKMLRTPLILSALFLFSPQAAMAESYPAKAAEKLANGIANVATGVVEIPKTIVITSRSEGVAYGVTAGIMMGIMQMVGRTLHGTLDVATFVVPTKPLVTPEYVWKDFNKETTYSSDLQLR